MTEAGLISSFIGFIIKMKITQVDGLLVIHLEDRASLDILVICEDAHLAGLYNDIVALSDQLAYVDGSQRRAAFPAVLGLAANSNGT